MLWEKTVTSHNEKEHPALQPLEVIKIADLEMNLKTKECSLDGEPLRLTRMEFNILKTLCLREGEPVSAQELYRSIWGDECINCDSHTITVHIRHLRKKFHEDWQHPKYIRTVWGVGYKVDTDDY
jgi:two-component system response regulator VanR